MNGIKRIAAERRRQVEAEGWSPQHDDAHDSGELALVAALFASPVMLLAPDEGGDPWPVSWDRRWDKRGKQDRVTLLAKAGALIAAEIDRLNRAPRCSPCARCEGRGTVPGTNSLRVCIACDGSGYIE